MSQQIMEICIFVDGRGHVDSVCVREGVTPSTIRATKGKGSPGNAERKDENNGVRSQQYIITLP